MSLPLPEGRIPEAACPARIATLDTARAYAACRYHAARQRAKGASSGVWRVVVGEAARDRFINAANVYAAAFTFPEEQAGAAEADVVRGMQAVLDSADGAWREARRKATARTAAFGVGAAIALGVLGVLAYRGARA